VHPDQHALAAMIPSSGSDSGNALLYFANDGGIYRALDGFHGLASGSCLGINQFDDLKQKLGSMAQFVSFSQHWRWRGRPRRRAGNHATVSAPEASAGGERR
jgi:hypothetical protein